MTRDEFCWTATWQVGDLIIWDNRCTMHCGDGFAGHGRRRMHRLMTKGERPVWRGRHVALALAGTQQAVLHS